MGSDWELNGHLEIRRKRAVVSVQPRLRVEVCGPGVCHVFNLSNLSLTESQLPPFTPEKLLANSSYLVRKMERHSPAKPHISLRSLWVPV